MISDESKKILNIIYAQEEYCNKLGFNSWSEFSLMIKKNATNSLEWIKLLDRHEKQAIKDYKKNKP